MSALAVAVALVLTQGADAPIRIGPGMQQTLSQPGLAKVAIADADVADVQAITAKGEVLLLGKRRGRTSLTLWLEGGRTVTRTIVVDDGRTSEIERLLHETVNPVLEVKQLNDRIVVDGIVDSLEELRRLEKLVGDDPNVTLLVRLNPRVLPFVAQQINEAFRRAGLQHATAVAVGGRILLEGSVADEDERRKAEMIAESYYAGWRTSGK